MFINSRQDRVLRNCRVPTTIILRQSIFKLINHLLSMDTCFKGVYRYKILNLFVNKLGWLPRHFITADPSGFSNTFQHWIKTKQLF